MSEVVPEWITTTRRVVERASGAIESNRELESLSKVEQELDGILAELSTLQLTGDLGRGKWWHTVVVVKPELVNSIEQASRLLDSRNLMSVSKEIKGFARAVRSSMLTEWRSHIRQTVGHAEELHSLVGVLADGEGRIADIARKLGDAPTVLSKLERALPGEIEMNTLDRIHGLYDEFESELPPTVKSFVAATARGGAAIGMLTAEVLTWLAGNDVLGSFKVVVGNPNEVARG